MIECDALTSILKKTKSIDYEIFEKEIKKYVEIYMRNIYISITHFPMLYNPICKVDELESDIGGWTEGFDKILLSKKLLRKIYEGDKTKVYMIFHELEHIKQHLEIKYNLLNRNTEIYLKDALLNYYQKKNNNFTYYDLNYEYLLSETDANVNGIRKSFKYFKLNHIELTKEEEYELMLILFKNKANSHYINRNFNKIYNIDLFSAFDMVIYNNPEWLKIYQMLNFEYKKINNRVIRKNIDEIKRCYNIYKFIPFNKKDILEYMKIFIENYRDGNEIYDYKPIMYYNDIEKLVENGKSFEDIDKILEIRYKNGL